MAAYALAPLADLNAFLLETKVHDRLFPYALLPTLHAARISFVHHALTQKAQHEARLKASETGTSSPPPPPPTTWAYDICGFLIMSWGGGVLVSFLLGQPPVQLLSIHPFLNYVGVHLLVTFALRLLPLTPTAKTIDTTLIILDGALRTQAVIMSVTMAKVSPLGAVQNSMLIQLVCGTLGATGGGQLAGMLSVDSPFGWSLRTPPVLRATRIVEVIDILAAALSSFVFGASTLSHPGYHSVLNVVYPGYGKPLLSPTGARALCTLLFASAFAYRATVLHWLHAPSNADVSASRSGKNAAKGVGATGTSRSKSAAKQK